MNELNYTGYIEADLNDNWEVVAEAIQTILRREGYPNPYETLKELTRTGQALSAETMKDWLSSCRRSQPQPSQIRVNTSFKMAEPAPWAV